MTKDTTLRKRGTSKSRRITDDTKRKENRGEGTGADYKPWIRVQEFKHNTGTAYAIYDPITKRNVHLMSSGEKWVWLMLRFDESVIDIREQFPLDIEETKKICEDNGWTHPSVKIKGDFEENVMTSDFLVTFTDGSSKVYSVKSDDGYLDDQRVAKNMLIEKTYWNRRNIEYIIVTRDRIDAIRNYAFNIQDVLRAYDVANVHDIYSYLKHLIAHHQLIIDLNVECIDYDGILTANPHIEARYKESFGG